jgi:hypothetical protein
MTPIAAVVLSALVIVPVSEHRMLANKALTVDWISSSVFAPDPRELGLSEETLPHLVYVDEGESRIDKIVSAGNSRDKGCEMSPEEFAKFYPPLLDWIRTTLTVDAHAAQTVASRGFSRLPLYFTEETLASTKVVLVDPLPMPPLSSMGLGRFADFERGDFEGITYMDTFFSSQVNRTARTCTSTSLFTSSSGDYSALIAFYFPMRTDWNASAIGIVHWRPWRTMLKRSLRAPLLFSMWKRWSRISLVL